MTATLNGTTIRLDKIKTQGDADATAQDEEFSSFVGSFTMPNHQRQSVNLGKITYSATSNGVTDRLYSGNITVLATPDLVDGAKVTPSGGQYINVGAGLIGEVTIPQIETFDAYTTNDW